MVSLRGEAAVSAQDALTLPLLLFLTLLEHTAREHVEEEDKEGKEDKEGDSEYMRSSFVFYLFLS